MRVHRKLKWGTACWNTEQTKIRLKFRSWETEPVFARKDYKDILKSRVDWGVSRFGKGRAHFHSPRQSEPPAGSVLVLCPHYLWERQLLLLMPKAVSRHDPIACWQQLPGNPESSQGHCAMERSQVRHAPRNRRPPEVLWCHSPQGAP